MVFILISYLIVIQTPPTMSQNKKKSCFEKYMWEEMKMHNEVNHCHIDYLHIEDLA